MANYIFNPDSAKVHNVAGKTAQCNFPLMDGDEYTFRADSNSAAIKEAKSRFSSSATGCEHCM